MSITLDSFALPDGLVWTDEFAWSPRVQKTDYSLTGALIVQEAVKQAGRPITLTGGKNFAWLTRTEVIALRALLDAGTTMTLTLHDNRTFSVIAAGDSPLAASPLPVVLDSGPANPNGSTRYVLETLKLMTVAP